jgi:AraC-like DNA-binding protein
VPYSLGGSSPAVVLSGAYPTVSKVHLRLLTTLPPILHRPADATFRSLLELVVEELAGDQPGRQAFLDRLLDLLLARAIRSWLTLPDGQAPAWYRALGDDIVGPALQALHDQPTRPWTVASLAEVSSVSRAVLARRFTRLVGEPPLTYLTCWRMTLAAGMLRQPGTTVTAVARDVGYTDPFAFSTAFKRAHGMSPSDFRDAI